ncbi:hypothetical protein DV515_00009839 [Chloebia gouldiae]|uniref:Uncharacterized protein n=1 Tax=Chloebia gouldiae TaxID=44316 RepID=A0A3L8SC63_CHLGU|nr:hypothetical protein DV515_00009839 [Chloebia gouldiae]
MSATARVTTQLLQRSWWFVGWIFCLFQIIFPHELDETLSSLPCVGHFALPTEAAVPWLLQFLLLGEVVGAEVIPLPTCTETSVHLSDSENPAASKIQELSAALLWCDFLHSPMSCPCWPLLFFPELAVLTHW